MEQGEIKRIQGEKPTIPTQEQKVEQERTTIKKRLFLEWFEKTICLIGESAKEAGISRDTYYDWMKNDADFHKAANDILYREADMIESRLKRAIMAGDVGAVKFWLDRRDPRYKRNVKIEAHIIGSETLEDLLDKEDVEIDKQNADNKKNKQRADRKKLHDPGQKGKDGAVHQQSGPADILEKKDPEKPLAEAPAEGTK